MRPTYRHLFLSLLFEVLLFRESFISALGIYPIDLEQNDDNDIENENTTTSSVKSENTLDEDQSVFFKSIKPIEDKARSKRSLPMIDGSDIYAKSIRTAIEVSSHVKCSKPLTFFTALDEIALVNQTTQSLDVRLINPVTVATMTGGILGTDLYELHRCQFFWQKCSCNTTHNLDARVYYFNLKYESYEKALDYSDGVVIINFPIATNRDFPNPRFEAFSQIIQSKIKEPGCWTKVHSAFTYTWFVNFPFGSIYHSSKQEFVDEEVGKSHSSVVINLPLDSNINYISSEQFMNTFEKIKGVSEQPSSSVLLQVGDNLSTERHKGVCVLNLPA